MVNSHGLLRIFWPSHLGWSNAPGVIVGWRNSASDVFVVTILEDADPYTVETALRTGTLLRNSSKPVARIYKICARPSMHVLGLLNHPHPSLRFEPGRIYAYNFDNDARPRIYCPFESGMQIQLIFYEAPDPVKMQYLSLHPISLALHESGASYASIARQFDDVEAEEQAKRKNLKGLIDKMEFHTIEKHTLNRKEVALSVIISQINCSWEVAEILQKNTPLIGPRRKRSLSVSQRVVESATGLYDLATLSVWQGLVVYIYPIVAQILKAVIIVHRVMAEAILQTLEWRFPLNMRHGFETSKTPALKDVSACCQQVHLRLQQFSYYPTQYLLLGKRKTDWSSVPTTNGDYIRFYNSLWLIANDVIIGIALGSFIIDNAEATAQYLGGLLNLYTVDGLKRTIRWLMSYPGGLKLNTELAAFLGDLFLWVIEYWSTTASILITPHLPTIFYFIGYSSFAGASMPIAICSDLLSLLTIHIYSFYVASAKIFNWQLTIISSLFHLFRGKKRNVLRNRIDNCGYDLDQLLLGTILFTLLFFLLPTVVVFYLTFATARMTIISLKATLDTCLACLNHFPLFALMLRIKDSQRLPGGIGFSLARHSSDDFEVSETSVHVPVSESEATDDSERWDSATATSTEDLPALSDRVSYIHLTSTPLSVGQIFTQYSQLGSRIRKHYLSPTVLLRLLTGRFVPPLGRDVMYGLQYSVLPRSRESIAEVWRGLT